MKEAVNDGNMHVFFVLILHFSLIQSLRSEVWANENILGPKFLRADNDNDLAELYRYSHPLILSPIHQYIYQ